MAASAEAMAAAYRAQAVVPEAVLEVCTRIFDTLGASATSATLRLDRHWRNARTLATHDPAAFKVRMAGDWLVNGTVRGRHRLGGRRRDVGLRRAGPVGAVLPLVEQTPDLAHHQLGRGLPPGQLPHDLEELRVVLGQRGRAGVEGAAPLPQQLRALRERRPADPGLQRQQGRLHEHGHGPVLPRHLEQLLGRGVVEHHGPGGGQALAEAVPVVLDAHARLTHAHDGDGPVRLEFRRETRSAPSMPTVAAVHVAKAEPVA